MALVSNIYITAIGWYGDVDDEDCPANGKMPSPTVDDPLVLTVHFPSNVVTGEPIEEALADIYHMYPKSFLYRETKPGSMVPKGFSITAAINSLWKI